MKFVAVESESGAEEIFEAPDLKGAISQAKAWIAGGEWIEQEEYVSLTIRAEDGEETVVETVVGAIPSPNCRAGQHHDWQSPYEVVGGCRENPGVWSDGAGRLKLEEVCANCGCYRHTKTKSIPGQEPRFPERVTYGEPDQRSKVWAQMNPDEEGGK